jgi:hypothetical protein
MKIFQKPITIDSSSSILKVNNDTFAELVEKKGDFFNFKFSFKISLSDKRKNPRNYEKVVITVKRRDVDEISNSISFSNIESSASEKRLNSSLTNVNKKIGQGSSLPEKVSKKLYSGLQLISDISKKEDFISQVSVPLSSVVGEAIFSTNSYSYIELYADQYKKNIGESRERDAKVRNDSSQNQRNLSFDNQRQGNINPTSIIHRINAELCDITQPITDDSIKFLTSESLIDNPDKRIAEVSKGRPPLFFDISKYYLNNIPSSPIEETLTWYSKRTVVKSLEELQLEQLVPIKSGNKNLNLIVKFDLYKAGSNTIEETYTADLYMPSHVEAFESILSPPELRLSSSSLKNLHTLSITDTEKSGKIQAYNIYVKSIDDKGTVTPYYKFGQVNNEKFNELQVLTWSDLSIIRVIPVDLQNRESNVFTSIVAGPGHKQVGNLAIAPSHFGKNQIKIDILNIPKDCNQLSLYRRDCSENTDSSFYNVNSIKLNTFEISAVIIDDSTEIGRTYEYYVVALSFSYDLTKEITSLSNYAVIRNTKGPSEEGSIKVNLTNQNFSFQENYYQNSFDIATSVSKSENEKITQTIKDQLGEIYEQYLNPSSNSSSPLGEDSSGIPQYSNIFFHEIVRTNLNTAERETFELVSDGNFKDNQETQALSNVKAINPQHAYLYQVFTYKKNPIEIFKKFVARGTDAKGREWFYLPYKWKQPTVKVGKLYADDSKGIPVIDAYDNFTSESYGLTAQHQTEGSTQYFSISQVSFDRIDSNTMKITWNSDDLESDLVDSFVVMKVVNGIRGFVGRTCKNFIYHQITQEDLGSIYYIVVPIMSEFDMDSPGYSQEAYISPDGIVPMIKSTILDSKISNQLVPKINDNLFQIEKNASLISSVKQLNSIKNFRK